LYSVKHNTYRQINSGKREIEAILRRLFDDVLCSGLFTFSASILIAQHW